MPREASRECQPRLGRSAQRLVRRKSTRQERRRDCTANGPYPGAFALYIGRGSPVPRGLGRVGSSSRLASPERGSMSPLLIRRGYPALGDRSRSLLSVVEGPPTRRMLVRRLRLGEPFSILGVSVAAGGHPPTPDSRSISHGSRTSRDDRPPSRGRHGGLLAILRPFPHSKPG